MTRAAQRVKPADAVKMARPGDECLDCGRRRADGVPLRWAHLLTANDCWLCTDSWSCARLAQQQHETGGN